jgi:DNA mismatch repair protein MutL
VLEGLREEASARKALNPVEDRVYRIASTIACKRAVKAGTPLSRPEIEFLLARGDLAKDPRHCPHGRPTTVFFSRRDIEREFDRK